MHREFDAMKKRWRVIKKLRWSWRSILGWWNLGFAWRMVWRVWFGRVCFFFHHDMHSGIHANCCCRRITSHASSAFCAQHSTVINSTNRSCGSPLTRFMDLSLRSPVIMSLVSNYPGVQQCPPMRFVRRRQRGLWSRFRQMTQRRLLLRRYEVLLGGRCLPKTYRPPRLLILNLRGGR